MIPTLVFVVLLVFLILSATPSNPGRMMLGPTATEQQVQAVNAQFGLDKPVLERFLDYAGGLLRGDMGRSYKSQQPVVQILLPKFPRTLEIAVFSVLFSALIGIRWGFCPQSSNIPWRTRSPPRFPCSLPACPASGWG